MPKLNKRVYVLDFDEDDDMAGVVIRMHAPKTGEILEFAELQTRLRMHPEQVTADEMRRPFELFAKYLVSWNIDDDDDQPVPATLEGVLTLDSDDFARVNAAWQAAVQSVPDPLQQPSANGGTSAVPELPMESLSASRAS